MRNSLSVSSLPSEILPDLLWQRLTALQTAALLIKVCRTIRVAIPCGSEKYSIRLPPPVLEPLFIQPFSPEKSGVRECACWRCELNNNRQTPLLHQLPALRALFHILRGRNIGNRFSGCRKKRKERKPERPSRCQMTEHIFLPQITPLILLTNSQVPLKPLQPWRSFCNNVCIRSLVGSDARNYI